jgi:AraC family transcriptional regulator
MTADWTPVHAPHVHIAGISTRYVPLANDQGFSYAWAGRSHYLALHDLRLEDGEIFSDGSSPVRRKDLRGTLTFVPAECRVWGWSVPLARSNSFTALYFDPRQMDDEVGDRFKLAALAPQIYFSNPSLKFLLEKIRDALRSREAPDTLYVESLCVLSALELCQLNQRLSARASQPAGGLAPGQVRRLIEYMDAHLASDVGLGELADAAGLSRFHLIRAFKKTTGKTPYQFLLQRRVERARQLLERGRSTIQEIARAVGYKNTSRFISAFRRLEGTTPGSFAAALRVDQPDAPRTHRRGS